MLSGSTVDWNEDRSPQGTPGKQIATVFNLVVGAERDPQRRSSSTPGRNRTARRRLAHSHSGWTATIVLEGSIDIDGVVFTEGMMVVVGPDVICGPASTGRPIRQRLLSTATTVGSRRVVTRLCARDQRRSICGAVGRILSIAPLSMRICIPVM